MKKFLQFFSTLIVTSLFLLACKIGLGAAVDTQAPELNITNPSVGAVIRSDFAIAGTWSDDGEIKADEAGGLIVTLARTDKTGTPVTVNGIVDHDNGTWKCLINPSTLTLKDGEYQATVDIVDTYEHKTTQSITFTVDNTAPIIVLQRPSAKKEDTSPDSYGQTFTLEGQAADDNNVSSIDVFIYAANDPECTTELHKVHLSNVPPTIELDVAKFVENETNDYSKIYGSVTKNGTQNFLCKIIAYDGAQRYPADGTAQSDADKLGNSTDHYYLYEEISADVLNTYKITEVYHMNNGTYTAADDAARSATINAVQETLKAHEIKVGRFSLNPANNPTYLVSGRNPLARDGHDFDDVSEWEITNGSKIQIEVSTGLDGVPIDQETLGVYAVECDANGAKVAGASEIELIPQYRSNHKSTTPLITDAALITERKNAFSKSGTSHKITVQLDQNKYSRLEFGKTYIFIVKGSDQNNTEVDTFGNVYGFYFATSGAAPKLEVTEPVGISYLPKASGITIKGYTHSDVSYPEVVIKVTKDGTDVYTKKYGSVSIAAGEYPAAEIVTSTPNNRKRVDFVHSIPASSFNQETSAEYTITITASNGEKDTSFERTVLYDVEGPTVRIEEVAPEAVKYEAGEVETEVTDADGNVKKFLNGEVTVKVSMTDAYDTVQKEAPTNPEAPDHRPYIEVVDADGNPVEFKLAGETAAISKAFITTPAKQDFILDTKSIADGATTKKVKIVVHGWDRAGNEGEQAVAEYEIDQSTDTPVIFPNDPNSVTMTYANQQAITDAISNAQQGQTIKSVLTAGSSLSLKLSDDDGIYNYKFEVGAKDNDNESLLEVPTSLDTRDASNNYQHIGINPNGSPTSLTMIYSLPTVSGNYLCRLTVTDKTEAKNQVQKKFWIMVTGAAPDVSITTTPVDKILSMNADTGTVKSLRNAIKINSIDGPFTIKRIEKIDDTRNHEETIKTGLTSAEVANGDYVDVFVPVNDRCENKVTYLVIDAYNHEGTRELLYDVDNTLPTIDVDSITVPDADKTSTASFRFVAAADDTAPTTGTPAEKASNVSKIQYAFSEAAATAPAESDIMTINGATALSQTVIFNDESTTDPTNKGLNPAVEGKKKIWIRAIDGVGNVGAWVSKEFMFDKADPSLEIVKYQGTTIPETGINGTTNKNFQIGEEFKLKGTASDSYGIQTIKVWQAIETNTYTTDAAAGTDAVKGKLIETFDAPANGEWIVDSLPRDEADLTAVLMEGSKVKTGKYTYTVEVEDKSAFNGKTAKKATQTVVTTIDTLPPQTLNFTLSDGKYGETSLNGSAYTFRGEAKDNHSGSTGASKLWYAFTKSSTAPITAWEITPVALEDNDWAIQVEFVSGKAPLRAAGSTTVEVDVTTGVAGDAAVTKLYEGEHYLWIKAEDKAGNVTDPISKAFMVDLASPNMSDYGVTVTKTDNTTLPLTVNGTDGSCGVKKLDGTEQPKLFTLTGKANDTNGIKNVKVYQNKSGENYTDAKGNLIATITTFSGAANNEWSLTNLPRKEADVTSVATGDDLSGTFVYTIIIEDASGNSSTVGRKIEEKRQVIFDITPPTFESCSADETATTKSKWIYDSEYFNGEVKEIGSGWKSIKIKVDGTDADSENGWVSLANNNTWQWQYVTASSFAENDLSDTSYHMLHMRLEDVAGNVSKKTYYFRHDKAVPTGKFNTASGYANDTTPFTLTGYAKDGTARSVKEAILTATKDGDPYLFGGTEAEKNITSLLSTTAGEFGNFTLKIAKVDSSETGDDVIELPDGTYTFTLNIKDYANRLPTGSTITSTVVVDTEAPILSISGLDDTENETTKKWIKGTGSTYFKGDVSDSLSQVEKLEIQVDGGSWRNADVSGNSWTFEQDLALITENTDDSYHTVKIRATDNAGNTSAEKVAYFRYDKAAPSGATIDADKKYINQSESITIFGTVKDNEDGATFRPVKSVKVQVDGVEKDVNYTTTGSEAGKYSLTVSKDEFGNDGSYNCKLIAYDYAGDQANQATVAIVKDTVKPIITLENIGTWISGDSVTVTGTASDERSGLSAIKVKVTKGGTPILAETDAGASTAWSKSIDLTSFAESTTTSDPYTVTVYAIDNAGNKSDPVSKTFKYDKSAPEASLSIDQTYLNANNTVKVTGYAHDGRGASLGRAVTSATVTIKKGEETIDVVNLLTGKGAGTPPVNYAPGYVTTAGTTFGNFSCTISNFKAALPDGTYDYILEVKDNAGKSAKATAQLIVDQTLPTISFAGLDATKTTKIKWIKGTAATSIGGSVVEAGTGIQTIKIKIDDGDGDGDWETVDSSFTWTHNLTAAKVQALTENTDADNSVYTVEAYVIDNAGNESVHTTGYFRYDKVDPSITLNASTEYVNGVTSGDTSKPKVTLSGVAKDNINGETFRQVKSITVTVDGNSTFSKAATYNTSTGAYSVDIAKDELSEGKHKFIVTAEDYAGNTAKESVSVTFDTTAPTGSVALNATPDYTDGAKKWFASEQIKVKVSGITEATSGSGIETVEAMATGVVASGTAPTSAWSGLTKQNDGSYTGSVTAAQQGQNTITFRLTDKAGNVTDSYTTTAWVDTEAPETTDFTLISVDGEANVASKLTNRSADVVFIVDLKDKDERTPISKIELPGTGKISPAVTAQIASGTNAGKWKFTIKKEDIPASSGALNFKVYDSVGKSVTYSPFSFQVDTKAPSISFGAIKDADTSTTAVVDINDYLMLDITATDDQGFVRDEQEDKVTSVHLKYVINGDDTAPTSSASFTNELTIDQTDSPWTVKKQLSTLTGYEDNKYLHLQLTATDKAGNSADPVTKTLYINEDSDRPKITFTNIGLDGMAQTTTDTTYVYLKGTNTMYGLVEDDDGVDTLKYKKEGATTWTLVTVNNGSFNISGLTEGSGIYYFQVVEKELFESDTATTYETKGTNSPKLIGSDDVNPGNIPLCLKVDKTNPTISSVKVQPYSAASTANGSAVSLVGQTVGGATKNIVEFIVEGSDANGIKGAAIKLTQGSVTKAYRTSTDITIDRIETWTGVKAGTASGNNYTWTTNQLTLCGTDSLGFTEGDVTALVYIVDNAGSITDKDYTFTIDNTATPLEISSPSANGMTFYGVQANTFGGAVTGAIDIASIEYAIVADSRTTTTSEPTAPTSGWITAGTGVTTANITLDGALKSGSTTEYQDGHNKLLKEFLTTAEQASDDVCKYILWFRTTDKCGNTATSYRTISIIPNGDKPSVTVTQPAEEWNSTANKYVPQKIAGTLRIFGSTSIGVATANVDGVYVQIDTDYKETTGFNETGWKAGLQAITDIYNSEIVQYANNKWGIKADGTSIFSLLLNRENELNGTIQRDCAIRVIAYSSTQKESEAVVVPFSVDPNPPLITDVELVKLKTDGTVDESMNMAYTSNMWVSGDWWLRFNAHDDSKLKTLTIGEVGTTTVTKKVVTAGAVDNSDSMTKGNGTNGTDKTIRKSPYTGTLGGKTRSGQTVIFPLATGSGQGTVEFVIKAVENTDNNFDAETTIKLNYDNTAPELANTKHDDYDMNPSVQQTNGFYTLKGFASDTGGSGIERIAFYFVRRSGTARVFDPMYKNKSAAISSLEYSDGLFWKKKTDVTRSAPEKIELSAKDDNIHVGGLAKLGNGIYRIEEISDDGKTITLNASPSTAITTVYFAVANVVDNAKLESGSGDKVPSGYREGYYASISNDDGDGMYEFWTEDAASKSGQWGASINSTNIPDGIIELHYVAFDKAQNYSIGIVGNVDWNTYKAYTTDDAKAVKSLTPNANTTAGTGSFIYAFETDNGAFVSNNAPRIVSVTVGCDYNANGDYDDEGEKTTKYANEKDNYVIGGKAGQTRSSNVIKKFIASSGGKTSGDDGRGIKEIKGDMQVEIEIIGGNNDVYLQYSIDKAYKEHDDIVAETDEKYQFKKYIASDATAGTTQSPIIEGEGRSFDGEGQVADEGSGKYYKGTTLTPIAFTEETLKAAITTNSSLTSPTWFTFEIWDSTEELTAFTNSQNAIVKLPLAIEVNDTTTPNTVFNDLYWNSSTDNSVYINTTTDALEGHVELKNYLGTGFTTQNYGIDDDKVSGKVVFRGYAWDNKRLSKLRWGIASEKGNVGDSTKANTDESNAKQAWPQTYVDDVVFSNGTWTAKGDAGIGQPYYYFKVYDDEDHHAYLNGDGHKVYWELTVDTSYVQEPGKASTDNAWAVGKDLYVWVQATDEATNTTNMNPTTEKTNGTDAQNIRPNYKVDVVPYITGIKSRLDDNRSSNGRYQLANGETGVQLIGYNLKQGSANLSITGPTAKNDNYSTTIHGCVTINNINNNNAVGNITDATEAGKARNKYNLQPVSYNQTLTDDVAFDVWEFNNKAARTTDGVGFIQEPVMRYNPNNGNLGFAFSNGASRFSMARGTTYSYQTWEYNYAFYTNNAMVFDSSGNSIGISVGCDTQPSNYKAGRMNLFYSIWGRSNHDYQNGNFDDGTNSIHLDSIGDGTALILERRFSSTSIALAEHTDDPVLYVAYYDQIRDEVIFRYGHLKDSKGDTDKDENGQLVSGGTGEPGFTVTDARRSAIAGGASPYSPGEYLDLTAIAGTNSAGDVVCAVWYDGTKLLYSYKVNPCNDNDASTTYTSGHWSEAQTLISNGGQYCKIEADANGGIHIAAYDQNIKGLAYIYLPTYNTTFSEATNYFVVDAVNGPYDEIGLDVAVKTVSNISYAYPVISYYANGTPKMAYYSAGIRKSTATTKYYPNKSWENDGFTGKWDVCFIPSGSKVRNDHINVVLPKDKDGILGTRKTGNSAFATDNSGNTRANGGTVSDNKTDNPVLGYAIRDGSKGYMEIAERK